MSDKEQVKDKKAGLFKSGKMPKEGTSSPDQCWFCGKRKEEVPRLIAVGTGSICSECVAAASKLMGRQ